MPRKGTEEQLLLAIAKDAFAGQIAKRVRPLSRSYVERWSRCEFWLYRSVVLENERELRAYKPVVLEVLRGARVEDLLRICRETRSDLDDLWTMPAAEKKLGEEIKQSIAAVQAL